MRVDKKLWDFLKKYNYKILNQAIIKGCGGSISLDLTVANGKLIIIKLYYDRNDIVEGWDVFRPVSESNDIDETLKDLENYLNPGE